LGERIYPASSIQHPEDMARALLEKPKARRSPKRKPIPQELIYEMVDGSPIYYRNYKQVLTKKKSAEEIMGSRVLQARLIALIVGFLFTKINFSKYEIMTNELGYIYAPKNWRILDIAIFEKARVKKELFSKKYVKTAPKIVIEVDTKAELKASGDILSYVTEKTDDLLDAGVEKVIWILTESENVLIAELGKQWIMARWSDTIAVVDEITLNLEQLVQTLA
jgi:hypothetical protein